MAVCFQEFEYLSSHFLMIICVRDCVVYVLCVVCVCVRVCARVCCVCTPVCVCACVFGSFHMKLYHPEYLLPLSYNIVEQDDSLSDALPSQVCGSMPAIIQLSFQNKYICALLLINNNQ